jgi:hypothetical protein
MIFRMRSSLRCSWSRTNSDFEAIFCRQALCILTDLVPKGLGELRVVEDSDMVGVEVRRHSVGMADVRQGALDDNAIEAA